MNGRELDEKFKRDGLGKNYDLMNGLQLADGRAITHRKEYPETGFKFEVIDHTRGEMAYWFESGSKGEVSHDVGFVTDSRGGVTRVDHIHELTSKAKAMGYTSLRDVYSDYMKIADGKEREAFLSSMESYKCLSGSVPERLSVEDIGEVLKGVHPGLEDLFEVVMNGNERPMKDREANAKLKSVMQQKTFLKGQLDKLRSFGSKGREETNRGEK